jgi:hypothetical protein
MSSMALGPFRVRDTGYARGKVRKPKHENRRTANLVVPRYHVKMLTRPLPLQSLLADV